jgi:hypothetical protein
MMPARQYQLQGFTIAVHPSKKRIDVRPCETQDKDSLKIPNWIFDSPDAIWIAEGSAPLSVRAIRGEQIRRKIRSCMQVQSSELVNV